MSPGGVGMRRITESAVTLLPDPDSPTIASVSPASMSNETWSTAVTCPRSVLKRVVRLRTCSKGSGICAALASVAHLLLHLLVDPHAGIDRPRSHRAGAELARIVLHPRPPGGEDVGCWQPHIRGLVENLAGHLLEHGLALALVALQIDGRHLLVVLGIAVLRR